MNAFFVFLVSLLSLGETAAPEENASSVAFQQQTEGMTTYYFIRHAEKDESNPQDRDPQLTAAGKERAAKWAEIFKEVEFDLIFSSDYERTRETAETIANSQNKQVNIYDPRNLNDKEFQKKTKGKTVLVVGHSNTNPAFANLILEEKRHKDIDEKESGSLIMVTVAPNGTKSSQVLYIN